MPQQREKTHLALVERNCKQKRNDGKATHKSDTLYHGMYKGIEPRCAQQAKDVVKDTGEDSRKDSEQKNLGLAKLG